MQQVITLLPHRRNSVGVLHLSDRYYSSDLYTVKIPLMTRQLAVERSNSDNKPDLPNRARPVQKLDLDEYLPVATALCQQ